MGSLFYINVPTRTYEVYLRQQERQIIVVQEKDDVAKSTLTGKAAAASSLVLMNAVRRASASSANEEEIGAAQAVALEAGNRRTSLDNSITEINTAHRPSTVSTVDIYEATVEGGKKANIIISKDSMKIYTEDSPGPSLVVLDSKKRGSVSSTHEEEIIRDTYLEKHIEDCLQKFVIYDATWGTSVDGNFSQISFTVAASRSEHIINAMVTTGIGVKYESTLSVCAAIVYYNEHQEERKKKEKELIGEAQPDETATRKDSFGSKFIASIKSRLTVAQVVQTVQNNAIVTFDFIILIIVAAIIAALGLLENSSVSLVASMLISPLMGPIMAGCFGAVIHDTKLIKTGVISECIGLSICIVVGLLFGMSVAWHPFPGPWAKIPKWPTDEMSGRSRLRGIVVGAFIAIPSGAGVALSILAGNAGSLVGVAISASLLPPAVNAGLLWGVALVHSFHEEHKGEPCNWASLNDTETMNQINRHLKGHEIIYCSNNMAAEVALMGICSFGLTVINIILILISGAIVLKIKEVAPHTTRKTMNRFWKEDLKAMREYNKIHGTFNKQEIYNELNNIDNASEVRDSLRNDRVFAQVTQRNLFGNSQNILDTTVQDAANERKDAEAPSSGGSSWFGGYFSSKKPETTSEEVGTEIELTNEKSTKQISHRPHLSVKLSQASIRKKPTETHLKGR